MKIRQEYDNAYEFFYDFGNDVTLCSFISDTCTFQEPTSEDKRSRTRPTEEREKRRLIESPTTQFRHRPIGLTEKEDSKEMDSEESCDFAAECTSKKAKKFKSLSQWNKNTGI